jgi:hypothetical protein
MRRTRTRRSPCCGHMRRTPPRSSATAIGTELLRVVDLGTSVRYSHCLRLKMRNKTIASRTIMSADRSYLRARARETQLGAAIKVYARRRGDPHCAGAYGGQDHVRHFSATYAISRDLNRDAVPTCAGCVRLVQATIRALLMREGVARSSHSGGDHQDHRRISDRARHDFKLLDPRPGATAT